MKGQLTVFIIIGAIILIAIAVPIALIGMMKQEEAEQVGQAQVRREINKQVSDYVTSCLRLTATEGMRLLGEQGGVLYHSQGGTKPDFQVTQRKTEFLLKDTTRVAYAASLNPEVEIEYAPDSLDGGVISNRPPEYPWTHFPKNPYTGDISYYANAVLGWKRLPPLEQAPNSMRKALQNFTDNNIQQCTRWERFEEKGVQIEAGIPKTKVTFAEDTIFETEWVIEVRDTTTNTSSEIRNYQTVLPIRFRQMYARVSDMLERELGNFKYNISQQSGITFENKEDEGTLSRFADKQSMLEDKPYEFWIALPNRPPALAYLDQSQLDGNTVCAETEVSWSSKTLTVRGGVEECTVDISLPTGALDPDEQPAAYFMKRRHGAEVSRYEITEADLSACYLPFEVHVTDGHKEDCQLVCVRTNIGEGCDLESAPCNPGGCLI